MLTSSTREPRKARASDTRAISPRTVFLQALHSLGQKLSPLRTPLQKHVYFSRNLIPGVPTPSHLHQLQWHFWRDMRSRRSLRGLSLVSLLVRVTLNKQKKKSKSRFVFRMILTKSCLQTGLDWIFCSPGFFCDIVLLPCLPEAAVSPQATAPEARLGLCRGSREI